MSTNATIIIVTLNRPECVRRCLESLAAQEPVPAQIIVVDGSADDRTRRLVAGFLGIEYIHNPLGYGHMTRSRNLGLLRALGDVVCFIDDDAFPHRGWLAAILEPYRDSEVGGVGGRALNGIPHEEFTGRDQIGKLLPNGVVTGFFAANPGSFVDVDHLIGCNMSYRRAILAELGGLREDYPGTEAREDTDVGFRVRKLGYRLVFNPAAAVDHVGAPRAKGNRFDLRAAYYGSRNTAVLLLRNQGIKTAIYWRFMVRSCVGSFADALQRCASSLLRFVISFAGSVAGTGAGLLLVFRTGTEAPRNDPDAQRIRAALKGEQRASSDLPSLPAAPAPTVAGSLANS